MSDEKRILFLCDASDIDIVKESFKDQDEYDLTIETTEKILNFGVREYLDETIQRIHHNPDIYDGVVGTHDSSAVFAAVIAQETGKRFASVQSIINCQNKYLCRQIQERTIPRHTPAYCLALDYLRDPSQLNPPFFIKPVRSNISFGTHKIDTPEQLAYYIGQETMEIALFNRYYLDALSFYSSYDNALNIACSNSFLCEQLIQGEQVTFDGYVFESDVHFFGITKAVYHPRTNSFSHHEFPYSFSSSSLEETIKTSLRSLIKALGLDNSFFNVELRANERKQTFAIIEVNSRIAFQFAKTIESVTGFDPLKGLCDIAVGVDPKQDADIATRCTYCYNFELHAFADARILQTPTQSAYQEISMKYPEVRVRNLIHENSNLSDFKHNPESFRYCMIDIPGNSREEILSTYDEVVKMLGYSFDAPGKELPDASETFSRPPEQTKGSE